MTRHHGIKALSTKLGILIEAVFVCSKDEQAWKENSNEWHRVLVEEYEPVSRVNYVCEEDKNGHDCHNKQYKSLNREDNEKLHSRSGKLFVTAVLLGEPVVPDTA